MKKMTTQCLIPCRVWLYGVWNPSESDSGLMPWRNWPTNVWYCAESGSTEFETHLSLVAGWNHGENDSAMFDTMPSLTLRSLNHAESDSTEFKTLQCLSLWMWMPCRIWFRKYISESDSTWHFLKVFSILWAIYFWFCFRSKNKLPSKLCITCSKRVFKYAELFA